jgi:quinol monooxygenase YgiN
LGSFLTFNANCERYADQAAFDGHMDAQATKDLISYYEANPSLFTSPTEVSMSEISSTFARTECARATDPYVGYASIDYKDGTRDDALEGWKGVTSETKKNEPDTLSYTIVKDKANTVTVHTFEVYANESYFREVHAKSQAVSDNRKKYGDAVRTAFNLRLLKLASGFLHRDEKASPNL